MVTSINDFLSYVTLKLKLVRRARVARRSLFVMIFASLMAPLYVAAQSGLTELIPSGPDMPPVVPGGSPWTGGVKLAASFLGWLADQGVKSNINAKLAELKPEIDKAMPANGGVLIIIGVQQSEQPDNNGNYARSVLDGYVWGSGPTPKGAMDKYLKEDRLETGPAKGFVRRNVYFWKAAKSQKPTK
jgi:hypothetical protein